MSSLSPTALRLSAVAALAAAVVGSYAIGTAHVGGATARAGAPSPVAAGAGPTVSVGGVGRIAGTPDVLRLDLGAESRASTVSQALDAASASLTKVRDSLRAHGVAPADLQTSQLSVRADYDYPKGVQRFRGYVAAEAFTARLHRLATAGRTITDAVAAGGAAVRVNGVALDIDSDDALVAQARDRAFAAARAKAEQYARLAGRPLGSVTTVTESVAAAAPQRLDYAAMKASAADSVPLEAGSQQVSVSVSVVWSLR